MNVVRDLRNTITHLQAQIIRKEQQFTVKKKQYEEIINQLQIENQRLKSLFETDSLAQAQSKVFSQSKSHEQFMHLNNEKGIFIESDQYSNLVNENVFLKNEVAEISSNYQRQIEQITQYFEKIKTENARLLASKAHYSGQLIYIQKNYESFVKDTQSEKKHYKDKLFEYANLLQEYQNMLKDKAHKNTELTKIITQQQEKIAILERLTL